MPDWLPFGERKAPPEWVGRRDRCNVVGMGWSYLGYTMLGQNIWDGMRALDILAARPEVDPERLGVIGLSYGGTMALHLAINDPRLKAAVVSGYLSTVRGDAITMRGRGNFCLGQHVPGLLRYGDIPEMAGLIAPKPLLIESGQKDLCFIIEDARRPTGCAPSTTPLATDAWFTTSIPTSIAGMAPWRDWLGAICDPVPSLFGGCQYMTLLFDVET